MPLLARKALKVEDLDCWRALPYEAPAIESVQPLTQVDPDIARVIEEETRRQEDGLELIASENFVSPAVLEALGSVLTNKYAEGYPGKRYYGGCEVVDVAETLAIDRVKLLFGAEYANVQPHSGSQANMAAYMSVLKVGDTILSLDLNSGGHIATDRRPRALLRAPRRPTG